MTLIILLYLPFSLHNCQVLLLCLPSPLPLILCAVSAAAVVALLLAVGCYCAFHYVVWRLQTAMLFTVFISRLTVMVSIRVTEGGPARSFRLPLNIYLANSYVCVSLTVTIQWYWNEPEGQIRWIVGCGVDGCRHRFVCTILRKPEQLKRFRDTRPYLTVLFRRSGQGQGEVARANGRRWPVAGGSRIRQSRGVGPFCRQGYGSHHKLWACGKFSNFSFSI